VPGCPPPRGPLAATWRAQFGPAQPRKLGIQRGHRFGGGLLGRSDGRANQGIPSAGLVQATNGQLYGTTSPGGLYDDGSVFSLSLALGPFVRSLPLAGQVGSAVKIFGNGLGGVTSVIFNGTAAVYTVDSPTLITATVPAGATSGLIQVAGPKGALSSNVPFQVLP
jgi:uncharacterized repeat protein (TIGR03803 family)